MSKNELTCTYTKAAKYADMIWHCMLNYVEICNDNCMLKSPAVIPSDSV